MKSLQITLTQKGFDQIRSGQETNVYKEIKKYWAKRLFQFDKDIEPQVLEQFLTDLIHPFDRHSSPESCMDFFGVRFREIDTAVFKNGCARHGQSIQRFSRGIKSIFIDQTTPEQCARGAYCFVIELEH